MSYRTVIIESPYAGNIKTNLAYLRACMRDCLLRGEAPFASHALYTQHGVLRDHLSEERQHGIAAGFAWRNVANATIVYTDLGISDGMKKGIIHAEALHHPIEYRSLGDRWKPAKSNLGDCIVAGLMIGAGICLASPFGIWGTVAGAVLGGLVGGFLWRLDT